MSRYDVAVIGAGVHGASLAFHLAGRGIRPIVIERGTPASGPTGRSSAVVRGYYVNEFLARATRESIEMFKHFTDVTHGGEARFVACGALFLHAEEDGPKLHEAAQRLNAIGTKVDVLDRAALAADFPLFALDGVGWGGWEQEAGYADPAGTTYGFINRAVQLGAELRRYTRVDKIDAAAGTVRVTTSDGDVIEADKLVVCAGPWTKELLTPLGVDLPLRAERHIIATYGWGNAENVPFVWASIPDGLYFKPEVHAQYLVGTLLPEPPVDPDDFDEELAPAEQVRITVAAVERLPTLQESEARSGYAALYDVSPDWQPVVGEVEENIFVVTGTSGHGFKWAPALGRHVADLVTGAEADPALAQFHPDRFTRGHDLNAGYGEAKILG